MDVDAGFGARVAGFAGAEVVFVEEVGEGVGACGI